MTDNNQLRTVYGKRQVVTGALAGAILVLVVVLQTAFASVLSDYVRAPDSAYAYTALGVTAGPGFRVHALAMSSQRWPRNNGDTATTWRHALDIVVPDNAPSTTAMLLIGSGSNEPLAVPDSEVQLAAQIAVATRSVVAVLGQIPNQPLAIANHGSGLSEDALVAASWDEAMGTGDYTNAAYFPMTKAAVRALDTVQDYMAKSGEKTIDDFVVVGFSKRGATTWLTAAVDARVRAFAPGVFDVLNMAPQFEHHFEVYGFYAPAVADYVANDILRRVRTPEGAQLVDVVDPYSYRALLDKPKFLINASGDQFFLPDSARFYLANLPGETRIRYVPNTDHSLSTSTGGVSDALAGLVGWYQSILLNVPRPSIDWTLEGSQLRVKTSSVPLQVRAWQADNPSARDFRKETIGEAWRMNVLSADADGFYMADITPPPSGFRATFIEAVFPGPAGIPQTYSTRVFVTPDTLPFELSDPIEHPRGFFFWRARVLRAVERGATNDPIASFFPFPVLGRYVTSLRDAASILIRPSAPNGALQQCLVTRLNIANGDIGWYTRLERSREHEKFLWNAWLDAKNLFDAGSAHAAEETCESLNRLH